MTGSHAAPAAAAAAPSKQDGASGRRRSGGGALLLASLGVVFGDIGTSPLYALHTVFTIDGGAVRPTPSDVYGVVSLIVWSVTLIVSVKYVGVIMRADNDGEGGVMWENIGGAARWCSRWTRAATGCADHKSRCPSWWPW